MRCSSLTTLISLRCKVVKPRHTSVDRPESRRECFCFLSETLEQVLGHLSKKDENLDLKRVDLEKEKNFEYYIINVPRRCDRFAGVYVGGGGGGTHL